MADSCFIPLIIRHGTKAQLIARGSLLPGELGWTSDEDMVYVGDGSTYHLVGRALSDSGNPVGNGVSGQLYVNTATSGIFFSNGSGWIPVGANSLVDLAGTLDDIHDGVLYQRVAASEVDASGFVLQINDGSHTVTASQARDHIDDVTIHRSINDSGSASTDLWSAQKIMEQLGATVRNIDWQDSVISRIADPPAFPINNERYIVTSGTGLWSGWDDSVSHWLTASGAWMRIVPNEGFCTWVESEDKLYLYNGTNWTPISSVTYHNYLAGLQGGGTDYYHLSLDDFNALTANRSATVQHIVGTMVSGTQQYITVTYNELLGHLNFDVSIPHSSTTGQTADDHHNEQHSLTSSSQHTVTTISGYVLKATGVNSVDMAPISLEMLPTIPHSALSGIGPDDHHPRLHSVLNAPTDHSWGSLTDNTLLGVATSASGVLWISTLDGGSF